MLKEGYQKYIPFQQINLPDRTWPNHTITQAPTWVSVDLRDGNQALIDPMNLEEKLDFFKLLVDVGFKEIEIGFPSASETEYEICRALIERNLIPDDVTIQVLVQAREHLIRRTFEAIHGAKNVIVHFYNSTSTVQRKVVFHTDVQGVTDIAVNAAELIRKLTEQEIAATGMNIRYEYSPESFSGTEMDNAVYICEKVLDALGATAENPTILNLPNTVEMCTANTYADQIEYFIRHLPGRERAIISIHPHNDRGTGVAATELAMLAGAERVEGTLFGNGERTGNVDIVTLALNMYSQGVDPKLDFHDIRHVREVYERCTHMQVPPRWPYGGDLVFTAFSGSHQDAINKGFAYMQEHDNEYWEMPYLPIDPADIGREYEPIIRINSQSGKGGAAFVMHHTFGFDLPKEMHGEFGAMVQKACDESGRELLPKEMLAIFRREYLEIDRPYQLKSYRLYEENAGSSVDVPRVHFEGNIRFGDADHFVNATGNGPIDAFFKALAQAGVTGYTFVNYREHAISRGSDSKGVSYIHLRDEHGRDFFGVGIDGNISLASIKGILCAINRSCRAETKA